MDDRDDNDKQPFAITPEDSLGDATRRELLLKLTRIGAATVPISIALLDADEAKANSSGGKPNPGIVWGS